MTTVLIVDDSPFMRRTLAAILEQAPDIKVVGTASNGEEALKLIHTLDPDVVTLDVEMPRMDGLTTLSRIMKDTPRPVLMISSLTQKGADTTLKALEMGALDFLPKFSSSGVQGVASLTYDLPARIKALGRRKTFVRLLHRHNRHNSGPAPGVKPATIAAPKSKETAPATASSPPTRLTMPAGRRQFDAIGIGVSTGGPPAVTKILSALPEDFPSPILIAQHMPESFTGPFAKRLDTNCAIRVKEAEHGEPLHPGWAYIAPGGKHLRLSKNRAGLLTAFISEDPRTALYKPSVSELMESMGRILGRRALGITLTGMGSDGLQGTRVLKQAGGCAIAQSEDSCVVYGMPKAVVDAGLADIVADLDGMATIIITQMIK